MGGRGEKEEFGEEGGGPGGRGGGNERFSESAGEIYIYIIYFFKFNF